MFRQVKRSKLFAIVVLLVALLSFPIYRGTMQGPHRPTMNDFKRIEFDMTDSEVESILGSPHRVVTFESGKQESHKPESPGQKVFHWDSSPDEENRCYFFHVTFDVEGRVIGRGFDSGLQEPLLERMLKWLRNTF